MSFSVSVEPYKITPVYNHMTYVVSETNYGLPYFKYVFNLFVNGSSVNTSKLYPLAGGTCQYDPSELVQNYLTYEFRPTLTGYSSASSNEILNYYVVFGEEYLTGGTFQTTWVSTGSTKIAWNGCAEFQDAINLSSWVDGYTPGINSAITTDYLNIKEPGSSTDFIDIFDTEYRVATMFRLTGGTYDMDLVRITTTCTDGSNKVYVSELIPSGSTVYDNIFHYEIGVPQINSHPDSYWNSTTIPAGKSSAITYTEDLTYMVDFCRTTGATFVSAMKPLYFKINHDHCKGKNPYTLVYQSKGGGFGYLPVYAKNFFEMEVLKETYRSKLPYNYTSKNHQRKVFNNQSNITATLTTEWMTSQKRIDEYIDCIQSPVHFLNMNEVYYPVIIENFTSPKNILDVDKFVTHSIKVRFAYDENNLS